MLNYRRELGMESPGTLLDAGLVTEQRYGRERRQGIVPAQLRPVRDWMAYYERFWDEHLERLEKDLTKRDE
jgi:hypothetical protein